MPMPAADSSLAPIKLLLRILTPIGALSTVQHDLEPTWDKATGPAKWSSLAWAHTSLAWLRHCATSGPGAYM